MLLLSLSLSPLVAVGTTALVIVVHIASVAVHLSHSSSIRQGDKKLNNHHTHIQTPKFHLNSALPSRMSVRTHLKKMELLLLIDNELPYTIRDISLVVYLFSHHFLTCAVMPWVYPLSSPLQCHVTQEHHPHYIRTRVHTLESSGRIKTKPLAIVLSLPFISFL